MLGNPVVPVTRFVTHTPETMVLFLDTGPYRPLRGEAVGLLEQIRLDAPLERKSLPPDCHPKSNYYTPRYLGKQA